MSNKEKKEEQNKRGLVFLPFHKVRKTKNGNNILIYLNSGSAISISKNYILKVLEDNKPGGD